MDEIEMVNTKKRNEIKQTIEDKVNETRSDWNEKYTKVTSGLYKCSKCGGDKIIQSEMQTRSAYEPMTIFIRCADWGNSWKI
jgi:DNA-directed RNA polymerase subunit M/transcription elongation factor TFIIS